MKIKAISIIIVIFTLIFTSCISNPFWHDDDIKERSITGKVVLSDNEDSCDSVYVWLEVFNLGTYTNNDGEFEIVIPPVESQNNGAGLNGDYKLYVWLANYEIRHFIISFSNGEFSSVQNYIDGNGEFLEDVNLQKMLSVKTTVTSDSIDTDTLGNNDKIYIDVQLTSNINSELSIKTYKQSLPFPYREQIHTGIILESLSDPANKSVIPRQNNCDIVTTYISPFTQMDMNYELKIDSSSNYIRQIYSKYNIQFDSFTISSGDYKVYPYILFLDNYVPDGLINSIDEELFNIKNGYYKIPIKRDDAVIRIDLD